MSKLPTTEQINHINKCIDSGLHINAIKMLRDITGMGLPRAKHIIELQTNVPIELQTNGPRSTMDRAGVLNAYDGLWEYFKSLHVYDSQIDDLHKAAQRREATIKELTDWTKHLETLYNAARNERDEYKSRLNAMRTTAGLEPLSTQQDGPTLGDLLRQQQAVDQLTSEAQRDGFYNNPIQCIQDPEICAMDSIVGTLTSLDPEARCRVLDYLQRRFE